MQNKSLAIINFLKNKFVKAELYSIKSFEN